MQHIDPEEAVKVHCDLGRDPVTGRWGRPTLSLGMHWGTFILTDEDILEPAELIDKELKKLNLADNFFITPKPGELLSLSLN